MLSREIFVSGMATLTKCYIGWKFDFNDDMQVGLWYSAFANLTEDQFISVIQEYMDKNNYPPTCIKSLTDIFVARQIRLAKIPPEKALHYVREVISDCGGWEYGGKAEIFKRLAKYPALLETVKEFEDTLKTMQANDTYTADRFRKEYEGKLWKSAEKKVSKFLALPDTPGDKQALGSGTLPYEQ